MSEIQHGAPGASTPPVEAAAPTRGADTPRSPGRRLVRLAIVGVLALGAIAVGYWGIYPSSDLERFQGDWQVSIAGRPTPTVIRIHGDTWQSIANAVEGKPYRITLNTASNPRQIDLDPMETTGLRGPLPKLHGIYAFASTSTVRVRVNDLSEPRPTTLDDPEAVVWELTRVKLDGR